MTLVWNLVSPFNLTQFLTPAFALLFYYIGVLLSVAKRNFFVGIRNPWTMSSDSVWQKTHSLGGKLFKFVALLSLVGMILPSLAIYLVFIPIILVSLFLYFYSYLLSRS